MLKKLPFNALFLCVIDILGEKVKIRLRILKRGETVRKNNKQFVGIVIGVCVTALIVLMIFLFMILQSFLGDKQTVTSGLGSVLEEKENSKVELSDNLLILVHNISEKSVSGYDIQSNNVVSKYFSTTTRVRDAYGNVIPIQEIKAGDIINLESLHDSSEVFAVSKSADVQSWKKISGITIDKENSSISVGGSNYKYTKDTMVIDSEGKQQNINNIGPYDVVSVQVYDNAVWSLVINEKSASISIVDIPVSTGTIEIDNSRLINFSDITEPIKVISGKHKLVIRMAGYEVIAPLEINVVAGEVYEISLAEAKKAYTIVNLSLTPKVDNYEINFNGETFKKGDEIKLQQAQYNVTITVPGYETETRVVNLTTPEYPLIVKLREIKKEEEVEQEATTTPPNSAIAQSRTVTLSTDPSGANVYIDGGKCGQTPYTVTLTRGTHTVLFEKEGYSIYSTSIYIDEDNDQNNFLYMLTKIE